jgi:hypothetical protein
LIEQLKMNSTPITDFYREVCDLMTRYGSTLPQPPATEENAIAFCRALAEEGYPVPDFPQMRDEEDTESEATEFDWTCDECEEGGHEDDEHIACLAKGSSAVVCADCLEDCRNCDGKVVPDEGYSWDYTALSSDVCECELCCVCEERKDKGDGRDVDGEWCCWDCSEEHDPVKLVFAKNINSGKWACSLNINGEEVDCEDAIEEDDDEKPPRHFAIWSFKAVSRDGEGALFVRLCWEKREDGDYNLSNIMDVFAEYDDSSIEPRNLFWDVDKDGFDF